jgi:hypothetical protein
LVTTVVHIQSLCSQICVYIHILQNIGTLFGQEEEGEEEGGGEKEETAVA